MPSIRALLETNRGNQRYSGTALGCLRVRFAAPSGKPMGLYPDPFGNQSGEPTVLGDSPIYTPNQQQLLNWRKAWWTFRIFFIFLCSRTRKGGGARRPGEVIKNRVIWGGGGGFRGGGAGGGRAPGACLWGGGGGNFFFLGAEMHTKKGLERLGFPSIALWFPL